MGNLAFSAGSVYGFCKNLEKKAQTSIGHLEEELLNQKSRLSPSAKPHKDNTII